MKKTTIILASVAKTSLAVTAISLGFIGCGQKGALTQMPDKQLQTTPAPAIAPVASTPK
jgi:predicted small lipoprotein YifL